MDSIIRQVVREELRRSSSGRPETASSTNPDDQGRSEYESSAAGSSRTVGPPFGMFLKRRPKNEDLRSKTEWTKTKTLGLKQRPSRLKRRPPGLKRRPLGLKRRPLWIKF